MVSKFAYLLRVKFYNIRCKYYNNFISSSKCFNIKGVDDTKEMFEAGYLKKWDDTSWIARHDGTSRHIALTKKGLKAFYKAMF